MIRFSWTAAITIFTLVSFASGTEHAEPAHVPKPAAHAPATPEPAAKDEVKFTTPSLPATEEQPAHKVSKPASHTATSAPVTKTQTSHAPAAATTSDSVRKLTAGNLRYTKSLAEHPNQNSDRRIGVSLSQKPFAVILGCADSRVPPELVFDQGLGDLFVVRVAGNVADPIVLGSIEYAVDHLGVGLVVVLGHERCGAVHAAVTASDHASHGEDHVGDILAKIAPAAAEARKQGGDATDFAVRRNVENVVKELQTTQGPLAAKAAEGKLKIIGARYDLDSGIVEFLESTSAAMTTQVDTQANH